MLPVTEKGRLGGCNAESGMESLPVTDSPHKKWWFMVPGRTFWPHPCICPCPVLAETEEGRTKSHSLKFKSDVGQVPPGGNYCHQQASGCELLLCNRSPLSRPL